jgi:hypothetical protein
MCCEGNKIKKLKQKQKMFPPLRGFGLLFLDKSKISAPLHLA